MPLSQVSVERLFSISNCVASKQRMSLRPEIIDQLSFLRANGRKLGVLEPKPTISEEDASFLFQNDLEDHDITDEAQVEPASLDSSDCESDSSMSD